jgi:uncharacterized protein (DUF736 family)
MAHNDARNDLTGELRMAFELKPGQGSLFKNDRKSGDKDPDYKGSVVDATGNEFWLNGWKKTSSKGVTYLSLSMKAK